MTIALLLITAVILLSVALVCIIYVRRRNIHLWLLSYMARPLSRVRPDPRKPIHVVFCIVNEFDPMAGDVSADIAQKRIGLWVRNYPTVALKHRDWDNNHPQQTFFFPMDACRPGNIEELKKLRAMKFGDIEVLLRHDHDTAKELRRKLESYREILCGTHGILGRGPKGEITYGIIHGDGALDNSRSRGDSCGVNNEISILQETGCYADFTLPVAPGDTQTRKINSIYYAIDDPYSPKSHTTGIDARRGTTGAPGLLLIQGPLTLDWGRKTHGIFATVERGEISAQHPPTPHRVDLWVRQHIHVKGEPNWIFIKLHTRGCLDDNMKVLLDVPMDNMFSYLEQHYNDGVHYKLHYVTARQMHELVGKIEKDAHI